MKSSAGIDVISGELGSLSMADRAALERDLDRLLEVNGPALTRLAASFTNTISDRDDLLQEIAIALWQALPRFRGECSERTFLFRIAHNRAISHLARQAPRRQEVSTEIEVRDPALNPESGLVREQRSEQLRWAIHQLPISYRQVTTLALEGLDYSEIGEVLGMSASNVGARLTRARQMLRESLEKGR